MPHGRDHRHRASGHSPHQLLIVKGRKVLGTASAPANDHHVHLRVRRGQGEACRELLGRPFPLDPSRRQIDVDSRRPAFQDLEDVAKRCAGRRGDNCDPPRQSRQRAHAIGGEKTLPPQTKLESFEFQPQKPLSLEMPIGDENDGHLGDFIEDNNTTPPLDTATNHLLHEEVSNILTSLSPREGRVIQLRFGLKDGRTHTLDEVGRKFGVTRERVRQIEKRCLLKLRKLAQAAGEQATDC